MRKIEREREREKEKKVGKRETRKKREDRLSRGFDARSLARSPAPPASCREINVIYTNLAGAVYGRHRCGDETFRPLQFRAAKARASSMVPHDRIGAPAEKSFPRSEQNCQITQNEFLVFQAKQERSLPPFLPPCLSFSLSLSLSLALSSCLSQHVFANSTNVRVLQFAVFISVRRK